jgi:hypothetical protein
MSCLSWLRRSSAVQINGVKLAEEGGSSTDSDDITVRSSAGIPGGLAGIKFRMKELGHFMNESNVPDPAPQWCEADRASQTQTNLPMTPAGSHQVLGEAVVSADFCNARGQSVDANLPTSTAGCGVFQPP